MHTITELIQWDSVKSRGLAKGVYLNGVFTDVPLSRLIRIVDIFQVPYNLQFYRRDTKGEIFYFMPHLDDYDANDLQLDGHLLE